MERGGLGRTIGIATVAALALCLVAGGVLMKLSGVGPGTADRIISYRQAHGPFRRAQDLEKVEGVGKGVLEKNEGRIAVK